jgi:hypothetical protein
MRTNYLKYGLVLVMAFLMSGCASFLTYMSPVQSEMVVKEKKAGDVKSYTYRYDVNANKIYLTKRPICSEMAEVERVAQKREIGYSPAMAEMLFFGLGLVDIVTANGIAENSRQVYPLGEYDTGKVMACGKVRPASNETLIIESKHPRLYRKVNTDGNGMVDLDNVLSDITGAVDVTIYPESDQAAILSYTFQTHQMAIGQFPDKAQG